MPIGVLTGVPRETIFCCRQRLAKVLATVYNNKLHCILQHLA
jgi:hypothetical protein